MTKINTNETTPETPSHSTTTTTTTTTTRTNLATLEPFLQKRIFTYLNLASRSSLRQCCTALYRSVEAFDIDLAVSSTPKRCVGVSDSSSASRDHDDLKQAKEELVAATELKRWMTITKDNTSSGGGSGKCGGSIIISPGTPNVRRIKISKRAYRYYDSGPKLIDGHILVLYSDYYFGFEGFDLNTGKALEQVGGMNGPNKDYVNTEERRISLDLTHYDGRHGLLAAGLELFCRPSSNPHGPWSGPYLTVWDLGVDDYHKNIRMRLDLRKPQYNVVAVSVVAPDKCAVLLKSIYEASSSNNGARHFEQENIVDGETAVILQWHRIPLNSDEMSSNPPPPPPPTPPQGDEPVHSCSMSCMISCRESDKRTTWRRQKELWDKHVESQNNNGTRSNQDNDDDDDNVIKYKWFPGSNTLLREDKVRQTSPPNNCACMHSDGKGILVVIAGEEVQFWHVGTMSLVRCCDPFERNHLCFSSNTMVTHFTTCTIVAPIEHVEDGEGYEEELAREQQQRQVKRPRLHGHEQQHDDPPVVLDQSLQLPGAAPEKAPRPRQTATTAAIDANLQYQAESKDSNISSATSSNAVAQPWSAGSVRSSNFDLVRCDTESVLRRFAHENSKQEREFEQGICGILDDNSSDLSLIKRSMQLPIGSCSAQLECVVRVAFSIRSQASDHLNQIVVMDVEPLSSVRNRSQRGEDYYSEQYEQACLGQKGLWTAWDTNFYPSSENSCERICVFDWLRGGVLDFPEHGESESRRLDRIDSLISSTQRGEERNRLVRKLRAIEDLKGPDRAPLSLRIDAHKLIICTGHEVSIWPTQICRENNGHSKVLLRGRDDLLSLADIDDAFPLDVDTKPLYSARPMDKQFCNRWDEIAYSADREADGGESHTTTDTQSIVRDFVAATVEDQEHALMLATHGGREIADAVFSWRYAVTVTSPADSDDSSGQMLSIFDSLGDWARGTHSPFGAEGIVTPHQNDDSRVDKVSKNVGIIIPEDREDDDVSDSGSEW